MSWLGARVALGTIAVALLFAGCGEPERSTAAYCEKYNSGFAQIKEDYPAIDQYEGSDGLEVLIQLPSAFGDIVALIGEMAEVAPDEIRTEVERVHDTFQAQIDGAGDLASNPLGALAGTLVAGLTNSGALERMNEYTVDHCGEPLFGASPQR